MPHSEHILHIPVTPEMREALDQYVAEHNVSISETARDALLRKIGRKDLVGTMPKRGRVAKRDV